MDQPKCDQAGELTLKARFSQQVVMNKCFLLNLEKYLTQIHAVVFKRNIKTA